MISSESNGHPMETLAAEFVECRRRGERPTIDEYAESHPEMATAIRELFPTIAVLEEVRAQQEMPPAGGNPLDQSRLTRLGDFRIVREIGRGGMGIVYEAVQESLGRRVAVKILARQSRLDESHRRRFLREARTAGRLHHTNIVPILGVGEQDGFDFYVMQFIDGIGLDAVLSQLRDADVFDPAEIRLSSYWQPIPSQLDNGQGTRTLPKSAASEKDSPEGSGIASDLQAPVPDSHPAIGGTQPLRRLCQTYWQDVALIGLQVAQALDYAHSQGTLHRDIKPANLLMDHHGTTWVADFGLAKGIEQEGLSRTGEVLGTLLYMAPEQWRGTADARSDLYSLGVTLYELLTLRVPCQIQDRMKSLGPSGLQPAIAAPRKLCPSLPVDLETIVMTAMAEEPEHRYQTAADLAADFARFLEDLPISVRRPTLRERWSRWRRRNPAAAALSIVATVLAALVAVVFAAAYVQTRAALGRESTAKNETQAALQRVSAANENTTAALTRESAERQRAEKTLATSLQSLENVFRHLVPDQVGQTRAIAVAGDEKAGPPIGTQPVVSPETAALLEDLRKVYDQLGSAGTTSVTLSGEAARATRRLGDIYARLGNFDRAESAYRQALDKYQTLQTQNPAGPARLEIARLHNDLGTIYGRQMDAKRSQAEHQIALALLQGDATQPTAADSRFELARTDYLLGRGPDRQATPDPRGGNRPPPPHRPPPEFERRRPGHRPPPGDGPPPGDLDAPNRPPHGPGDANTLHPRPNSGNPQELHRAIALLEPLVKEDPKNPAYRYLLAQCYREDEGPGSGPLPEIDQAEQLLKTLVKDYPHVADYRFELADTYAMLDVRELPPDLYRRAEQRLRAALEQSADLVDGHPYAPDYAMLHVHILHKLAHILRDTPPDQRVNDRARMDEAGQLYQEAVRRQSALVKRFPDNIVNRFWLAKVRMSLAELLIERRQSADARTMLETAVAEIEPFYQAHSSDTSLRQVLYDLYDRLGESLERMEDDKGATEARKKANKIDPSRQAHWRGGPPPGHHRPPPGRPDGPPPDRDE